MASVIGVAQSGKHISAEERPWHARKETKKLLFLTMHTIIVHNPLKHLKSRILPNIVILKMTAMKNQSPNASNCVGCNRIIVVSMELIKIVLRIEPAEQKSWMIFFWKKWENFWESWERKHSVGDFSLRKNCCYHFFEYFLNYTEEYYMFAFNLYNRIWFLSIYCNKRNFSIKNKMSITVNYWRISGFSKLKKNSLNYFTFITFV